MYDKLTKWKENITYNGPGVIFCKVINGTILNIHGNPDITKAMLESLIFSKNILYIGHTGNVQKRITEFLSQEEEAIAKATLRHSIAAAFNFRNEDSITMWLKTMTELFFLPCNTIKDAVLLKKKYIDHYCPPFNIENNYNGNELIKCYLTKQRKQISRFFTRV